MEIQLHYKLELDWTQELEQPLAVTVKSKRQQSDFTSFFLDNRMNYWPCITHLESPDVISCMFFKHCLTHKYKVYFRKTTEIQKMFTGLPP